MKNKMKNIYSYIKKLKRNPKMIIILAICFIITIFAGYLHNISSNIGINVGETTGGIVGVALGSADGLFNGLEEGSYDGTEAGLSAEDTNAEMKGFFEEIGKLEVMSAGVTLKNIFNIGDAYKELSILKGNAVFTIDLSQAKVGEFSTGVGYIITIPRPKMDLYLDINSTKVLAEVQNVSWSVDAEDGLIGYLNSLSQIEEHVNEAITNYDELVSMAEDTALKQVKQLVSTVSIDGTIIEVTYQIEDIEK